jgi:hypothetical protein
MEAQPPLNSVSHLDSIQTNWSNVMMPISQRIHLLREGAKLAKDGTFLNDTADVLEQVTVQYSELWEACAVLVDGKDKDAALDAVEGIMQSHVEPKLKVLPPPGQEN